MSFKNGKAHTPSGWHDDAMHRDAGHDGIQIAVWEWLKLEPQRQYLPANAKPELVRARVEFEMPLHSHPDRYRPQAIIAFADVCEVWTLEGEDCWFTIYEIKPSIGSVGAVVRQCAALRSTLDQIGCSSRSSRIIAVIPNGDPKLAMLRDVMGEDVLVWDARKSELSPEEEATDKRLSAIFQKDRGADAGTPISPPVSDDRKDLVDIIAKLRARRAPQP